MKNVVERLMQKLSLRLIEPIMQRRLQIGDSFAIRAEVRSSGASQTSVLLVFDEDVLQKIGSRQNLNPQIFGGQSVVEMVVWQLMAIKKTAVPSVVEVGATAGSLVQLATFNVEVQ